MIVSFTKTSHKYVVGQPKRSSLGQRKKVDGFIYSFVTDLLLEKIDWNGALDVITECLLGAFNCTNVRDMEMEVDILSGQYVVRFTSATDMRDLAYAALVLWETNGKRLDNYSENFENYSIFAERIELDGEDITASP